MDIELLYFDGCPNWEKAAANLAVLAEEGAVLNVVHRRVDTDEDAHRFGFRGSPSILIDGVDVFAPDDAPVGLSCRMFKTPNGPAGSPTLDQLREVITAHR